MPHPLTALAFAVTFATSAALASPVSAGSATKVGDLVIEQPWSRATPKAAKVGAGYLTITNNGAGADRLLAVSSPIAGVTEIHTMTVTDGIMKMRKLQDGIEIPAGESITLAPGGDHVMFMQLKTPIRKDDKIAATLTFEKAGTVNVTFGAVKIGSTPKGVARGSHAGKTTTKAKRGSHSQEKKKRGSH
ncbi:MAG: copper chaperone PCu(A)C [Pseudomonadota bacterium]